MTLDLRTLYDVTRKYYALIPPPTFLVTLFIDAPFGRFAWKNGGLLGMLQVDGIKSWIIMELFAPSTFLYSLLQAPFSSTPSNASILQKVSGYVGAHSDRLDDFSLIPSLSTLSSLSSKQKLLASLFLVHYTNRALISPLRSPGRSPSNLMVVLSAIVFNIVNGSLMGSYISSEECREFLQSSSDTKFWFAIALWAIGFIGNVVHDETLLNLRRRQQSAAFKKSDKGEKEMHYAIPHGLLYRFVSYPNYLCEWIEWIGFALAASPAPSLLSVHSSRLFSPFTPHSQLANSFGSGTRDVVRTYTESAPPWLFVFAEIFTMASRAWRGHQWYKNRFPEYPQERTAVIPYLF